MLHLAPPLSFPLPFPPLQTLLCVPVCPLQAAKSYLESLATACEPRPVNITQCGIHRQEPDLLVPRSHHGNFSLMAALYGCGNGNVVSRRTLWRLYTSTAAPRKQPWKQRSTRACVCVSLCVQFNINGKDVTWGREYSGNMIKALLHNLMSGVKAHLVALQDEAWVGGVLLRLMRGMAEVEGAELQGW